MVKKKVIIFFIKIFILTAPLLILLGAYFVFDPFKVVHKYSSYYESGKPSYVILNRDYVSMETFLKNYPKFKYDSFIFGNSRSLFYEVADWSKYISSNKCFHFDASEESIYGIYKKIKFLNGNKIKIQNALIILDFGILKNTEDSKGILFIKHPLLTGKSYLDFQMEYIKAYFDYKFFIPYLDLKISKKFKPYMLSGLHIDTLDYNPEFNEIKFTIFEKMINSCQECYYDQHKEIFYKRDTIQKYYPRVIKKEQKWMLNAIANSFKLDSSNFKIVLSPIYDQVKLNPEDSAYLNIIFGKEKVFDFSGINPITKNINNYYEQSHYRPHVARFLLSEIYKNSNDVYKN